MRPYPARWTGLKTCGPLALLEAQRAEIGLALGNAQGFGQSRSRLKDRDNRFKRRTERAPNISWRDSPATPIAYYPKDMSERSRPHFARLICLVGGVLVLGCLAFVLARQVKEWQKTPAKSIPWVARSESLVEAGGKIVEAFDKHDTATLWAYTDDSEKEAHLMDAAKMDRFLRGYVWKACQGMTFLRDDYRYPRNNDSQLEVTRRYSLKGREIYFSVVVEKTDQGPKAHIIAEATHTAMNAKYGGSFPAPDLSVRRLGILVAGSERDAVILNSFGIRGFKGGPKEGTMTTWRKLAAELRQWPQVNKAVTKVNAP